MTGYDGKKFSQYVKADFNSGKLNYYNGNPDRDRSATQRNVVAEQTGREPGQQTLFQTKRKPIRPDKAV